MGQRNLALQFDRHSCILLAIALNFLKPEFPKPNTANDYKEKSNLHVLSQSLNFLALVGGPPFP